MKLALIGLGVAIALLALHRLGLWAERRGWIYYTHAGRGGALGNALLEIQAILEPSQRHVVEERRRDERDEQEKGEPPEESMDRASGTGRRA